MFVARYHTDFNEALNKVADTAGIEYSKAWDMSTPTGRVFMTKNHTEVGRAFAAVALSGKVSATSRLSNPNPSPIQKACLSAIIGSRNTAEYDSAMRAAVKHGALTNTASLVFSRPNTEDYRPVHHALKTSEPSQRLEASKPSEPQELELQASEPQELDLAPSDAMELEPEQLIDASASPARARMMSGGESLVPARKRNRRKSGGNE